MKVGLGLATTGGEEEKEPGFRGTEREGNGNSGYDRRGWRGMHRIN